MNNKKRIVKRSVLFVGMCALGLLPVLEVASFSASGVTLGIQNYNNDNQLISSDDGTGQLISYAYDADGKVQQITTRNGNYLCAYYNSKGLETTSFSATAGQGPCPKNEPYRSQLTQYKSTVVQSYDPVSHKLLTEGFNVGKKNESDHSFTYYTSGQMKSESDGKGHTLTYTYDDQHRLLSITAVNGAVISYTYNGINRVVSSTISLPDSTKESVNYTYTPYGNLEGGTFSDGVSWKITYDQYGRPLSKQYLNAQGQVVYSTKQTLSSDDQILTNHVTEDSGQADKVYSYNGGGQLSQMTCSGAACPVENLAGKPAQLNQQDYTFNNLGEIKSVISSFKNNNMVVNTTYNYDEKHPNQMTSITKNGQPVGLSYDKDGNIVKLGDGSYIYNAYDKMTGAVKGNDSIDYTYHGSEGLASRQMNGGDTMSFVYSLAGLLNVVHSNGSPTQTVWRGGLQSVQSVFSDDALPGDKDSVTHYFTNKAKAPVYLLTNKSGSWKGIPYAYSSYGRQKALNSSDDNTQKPLLGFDGQLQDPVTGDVFFNKGERVYNPKLRLFMQHDFLSPFKTSSVSGYDFSNNDPINGRDPSGHISAGAAIGIEVGVGVALLLLSIFTLGFAAPAATAAVSAEVGADIVVAGEVASTTDAVVGGSVTAAGEVGGNALNGGTTFGGGLFSSAVDSSTAAGSEVATSVGEGIAEAPMIGPMASSATFGISTTLKSAVYLTSALTTAAGISVMSWGVTNITTAMSHVIQHDQVNLGKDSINAFVVGVGDFVGAAVIGPVIGAVLDGVSQFIGPGAAFAIDNLGAVAKIVRIGGVGLAAHLTEDIPNTIGQTAVDDAITNKWNHASEDIINTQQTAITGATLNISPVAFDLLPAIGSWLLGGEFRSPLKALEESISYGAKEAAKTMRGAAWVARDIVRRGVVYHTKPFD